MEFVPEDGSPAWTTPLAHRQYYPQELEMVLHYNGFVVAQRYGDFLSSPLRSESETILLHCKKATARGG